MTAEGFWWDCGLIFDKVSAGVFGVAAQPVGGHAHAGVSLGGLAMFAGQDVAGFQIEVEGLQWHGAFVI